MPDDLRDVLLDILTTAVLQIRARGWAGDADACAVAADHVHNLPALLKAYSPALLVFYWDTERPAFIAQCNDAEDFECSWARLASIVERERA